MVADHGNYADRQRHTGAVERTRRNARAGTAATVTAVGPGWSGPGWGAAVLTATDLRLQGPPRCPPGLGGVGDGVGSVWCCGDRHGGPHPFEDLVSGVSLPEWVPLLVHHPRPGVKARQANGGGRVFPAGDEGHCFAGDVDPTQLGAGALPGNGIEVIGVVGGGHEVSPADPRAWWVRRRVGAAGSWSKPKVTVALRKRPPEGAITPSCPCLTFRR